VSRLNNKNPAERPTNFHIYAFSWLSVFSASLTEIFSVIAIYTSTGSVQLALGLVLAQMIGEILISLRLSTWLERLNASWLALIAIPFRIAAFILVAWQPGQPFALLTAGICLAVAAAFSDVPRTVILSWWTSTLMRGQQLARAELVRYGALAAAPLIGGITFDIGGFAPIATMSVISGMAAALLLSRLWVQLKPATAEHPVLQTTRIRSHQVPSHVRLLWWATGLRYIAETTLYPLVALMLYNQTTSVGWIIALSVLASLGFGILADRVRAHLALSLALVALFAGWLPRLFELSLTTALMAAVLCAIGGKMMGLFEKKATFDFGDKLGNPPALAVLRERELIAVRVVLLFIALTTTLETTSALTVGVLAMALFSLAAVVIIRRCETQQEPVRTPL